MKLTKILALSAMAVSLTGVGCANYSSFQGGETLRKGETLTGAGVTYSRYEVDFAGDGEPELFNVPAAIGWFRAGLTDQLEVNAKVWLPFGATVGGKFMLMGVRGEPGLSLSVGLDLGAIQYSFGDADDSTTIFDAYAPVYVGYRVNPVFAVYAVPKYIFRAYFGDAEGTEHTVGSAFGVAIGESRTLYVEAVTMYNATLGSAAVTGGIGVTY